MKEDKTLLDKAFNHLKWCNNILQNYDDEMDLNIAGYHLQQAIEKGLQFKLSLKCIEYPRTHVSIQNRIPKW